MIMSDAEPARPVPVGGSGSDLPLRVGSALVLAPVAIGVAYLGGWIFAPFWGVAAIIVMWEWTTLVSAPERRCGADHRDRCRRIGGRTGGEQCSVRSDDWRDLRFAAAPIVLVMGMLALAAIAPRDRGSWVAAGVPYAGAMGLAPIVLRSDAEFGFVAMMFLFAVVWMTDIAAYFVGRAVGGPKLAPRLSPNKTWSGSIGGLVGAVLAAVLVVQFSGVGSILAAIAIAIALSNRAPDRRSLRICDQAPVRRQGRRFLDSRTWRADGPAGWLCRGGRACLPDRPGAWRYRCTCARLADMVT